MTCIGRSVPTSRSSGCLGRRGRLLRRVARATWIRAWWRAVRITTRCSRWAVRTVRSCPPRWVRRLWPTRYLRAVPRNVSAVSEAGFADRIAVRWSAPTTDADGGELTGLSGFRVYRSEGVSGSLVAVSTVGSEARGVCGRRLACADGVWVCGVGVRRFGQRVGSVRVVPCAHGGDCDSFGCPGGGRYRPHSR